MAEFAKQYCIAPPLSGSASDEPELFYVTPYEVGWGSCINYNHDFMGKEALLAGKGKGRKAVTLEWNTEDVGEVFMSQFRGTDVEVLWGQPEGRQKKIRATVVQFPYYQGKYRNETFDTEKIPRRYK